MNIYESAEDYLEMILMLHNAKSSVRSIDIAAALSVSKPSVSVAMKKLRESGYIHMDENNHITLTENGAAVAQRIYERHETITRALVLLGVEEATARRDACKIEHDLSDESFQAIQKHLNR